MNKSYFKTLNHKLNKKIKQNPIMINLYMKFVPVMKYFYFKEERLLKNGNSIAKSDKQSIIFFSTHKCASTLINNILEKLSAKDNLTPIHFSNYLPKAGMDPLYWDEEFLKTAFKPNGYYYGAFRMLYDIPNLENYKILLVLRDPRDVLTSHYFSTAFNHPVARAKTIKDREVAQEQGIDEYVLEKADLYCDIYTKYCDELLHLPNVLFLKYEDMITEFRPWLGEMTKHLRFNDQTTAIEEIIDSTSFTVKKEDKHSFIRNVKAGDHKNKLKPATIAKLDEKFKYVFEKMNYEN
jgi:hypothetical protein